MGLVVVTVATGGWPVVEGTGGYPVAESVNGRGLPVTKVTGKYGMPVTYTGLVSLPGSPTITSASTVSNPENSTLGHVLTANESVTWSLVGGANLARFELSGSILRWLSNGTKDFEAPNDADVNNAYIVQVRATDLDSNVTNQTITVTVTDVGAGAGPAAPVLLLTSGTSDNTPDFTLTGDLQLSDTVRFQYSTSAVFSGASEITNAIDAGEDAANVLNFSTGTLANGTWYFRARIERPSSEGATIGAWSNTETIAISSSFTPASLTGLIGWYNFDPGNFSQTTVSGHQSVTAMNDLSTANHDLTATHAVLNNDIFYTATGFNGHPCATFAFNSGDAALVNNSFAMGTGKAFTVYVAGTMGAATNANAGAVVYGITGDSDHNGVGSAALLGRSGSANSILTYRQSTAGSVVSLATATPSRFGAISRDAGGGSYEFFAIVNGSPGTHTAADFAFASPGNLVIGSRWLSGVVSADCWDGPIAEVVICNADIGDAALAQLDAYFVAKYGI